MTMGQVFEYTRKVLHHISHPTPFICKQLFFIPAGYVPECEQSSTVDYYFYRETLNSTASIADSGGIHWPIVVCLLAAWSVICICYIRGISTSGKVCWTVSRTTLIPQSSQLLHVSLFSQYLRQCTSQLFFLTLCWPSSWSEDWLLKDPWME